MDLGPLGARRHPPAYKIHHRAERPGSPPAAAATREDRDERMSEKNLDRRRMLSGGIALTSVCTLSRRTGAAPASADRALDLQHLELLDDEGGGLPLDERHALSHAPFRAEFLAWLDQSRERFALPVSAHLVSPSTTELRVAGLHPALEIHLERGTDINVYVTWQEVWWDILASLDVYAEEMPDGAGWRDKLCLPEVQKLHATEAACWREDGFEVLLEWFNTELVPATHLALYGGEGWEDGASFTLAELVRNGCRPHTGKPISTNMLRAFLPLRVPASATASDMVGWTTSDVHGFAKKNG